MIDEPAGHAVARVAALIDLGRHGEAAQRASAYLAAAPFDWQALCLLARARDGMGDPTGALGAARAAIAVAPEREWGYRLASSALEGLDRQAEAVEASRTAVRIAPHHAVTHLRLAQTLHHQGSLGPARESVERALALDPGLAGAHLRAGQIAAEQGRRDDAEAAYRRALAIDPQSAVAMNNLAALRMTGSGWSGGISGLGSAATGFASALRSSPRLGLARTNLDVIVHTLLARFTGLVLVTALVSSWWLMLAHLTWVPLVLVAVPLAWAVMTARSWPAELRDHLARSLRTPARGAVLGATGLAVVLVVVGAVAPLGQVAAAGALVAFVGRIVLRVDGRRRGVISTGRQRKHELK